MTCTDIENLSTKMVKGDSSEVFEITVEDLLGAEHSVASVDWVGTLNVKETLDGAEVIAARSLVKDSGNTKFYASLTPTESGTLDIQEYYMTIQIENVSLTVPFRKEIQIKLNVLKAGL